MKLPPFTLVYQNTGGPGEGRPRTDAGASGALDDPSETVKNYLMRPEEAESEGRNWLEPLWTNAASLLHASTLMKCLARPGLLPGAGEGADKIQRYGEAVKVAVWDLGARIGYLHKVVEKLNRAQDVFVFFVLEAAVPAGLVSRPEQVVSWMRGSLNKRFSKAEKAEIRQNIIANDFYRNARVVQEDNERDFGINYLTCITPSMIAGEENDRAFWNSFSSSSGNILLVSSHGLRAHAKEAGRPVEAAASMLIVARLLTELNRRLIFHEDHGCLFDLNEQRANVVSSLRNMSIENQCLEKIDAKFRGAAERMSAALREYDRNETQG